ncbi:MAG TPA: prolipoprotein diacylglyceryl transferase [Rhizomicrobium sp.]|jgi:phosphatidylglycerol:prolipoprotein diacylglycerol transferase|nr:prolipoprotein diacylglyceryl transferase [Rhizomicrobium sp.]
MVIPFPQIDPVLVHLGPIAIRWYAIAYIAGILIGWGMVIQMLRQRSLWAPAPFSGKPPATEEQIGDFVVWATLGVIVGGRLGWVIFYGIFLCSASPGGDYCAGLPGEFVTNPIRIVAAWEGGMSFHGAVIGVVTALWFFCRRHKLSFFSMGDLVCLVQPIGQFFGRIANFVNGELWGKPSDVPWAMIFPRAHDGVPRHPSQLYEAALEGILLFAVLQVCLRVFRMHERPGLISAVFLASYGILRFVVEFFREPDTPFLGWFSMGQALSIALILGGAGLAWVVLGKPKAA